MMDEEGIDNSITVIEMLVDYLTGDLVFVADENDIVLDCMHALFTICGKENNTVKYRVQAPPPPPPT